MLHTSAVYCKNVNISHMLTHRQISFDCCLFYFVMSVFANRCLTGGLVNVLQADRSVVCVNCCSLSWMQVLLVTTTTTFQLLVEQYQSAMSLSQAFTRIQPWHIRHLMSFWTAERIWQAHCLLAIEQALLPVYRRQELCSVSIWASYYVMLRSE